MHIDAGIIARCKKNDKAAFKELFQMYEKYLYKLCRSYVQNEQDALDMVQEICIKVFNNISSFDEKKPFHPWIRTIAVNTCLNFRRTCRYNTISLNVRDENDTAMEEVLASPKDTEAEVLDNELGRLIRKEMEGLSPKHRLTLALRYYEGLSYEEIAAVLKEPVGTVKTNIHRARNLIKEKLRNRMDQSL